LPSKNGRGATLVPGSRKAPLSLLVSSRKQRDAREFSFSTIHGNEGSTFDRVTAGRHIA